MSRRTDNLNKAIALDAATSLIPALTKELRDTAAAADWPDDIVALLSIEWDGEALSVTYPSEIADEVYSLEYGNFSDKPNSVIRKFSYASLPTIKDVLDNRTFIQVLDAKELFA